LGNFIKHVVGVSTNKGLKTLLKTNPTPCKSEREPTQNEKDTILNGFVPLNDKNLGTK
jgi:hypothetical protein